MRYFFNFKDGKTILDDEGTELADIKAVKKEAVQSSAELLKGHDSEQFWTGEPWILWVTDQPNGEGNTVLTLTFSSRIAGKRDRAPDLGK
jgi:hypothetical protein